MKRKLTVSLAVSLLFGALYLSVIAQQQKPDGLPPTDKSAGSKPQESPEVDISQSGDTSIRATLGTTPLEATIHVIQFRKTDIGFPMDLDSYNEVSLIQYIRLHVGKRSVTIPRSAFADLFNARKVWLTSQDRRFVLCLGGGDGADLYVARIYFDTKSVYRRALFDANNQNQPVEETSYRTGSRSDQ